MIKKTILLCLLLSGLIPFVYSEKESENFTPNTDGYCPVNFFYSKTCPHCLEEMKFLRGLETEYPGLVINYYITSENRKKFQEFAALYDSLASGVPRTFICDKAFVGFTLEDGSLEYNDVYKAYYGYQNQIEQAIGIKKSFHNIFRSGHNSSKMPGPFWVFSLVLIYGLLYVLREKSHNANRYWISGFIATIIISFFLFVLLTPEEIIKNFASGLPFPAFVFIIALADGFNPCAFTVLLVLLSLLTYTKSKKDMSIIGLVFIITSAIMYFIFIMVMIAAGAWALERYGAIIFLILGIMILIAGLINLKEYFYFQKSVSLTLSDEQKSKVMKKARRIIGHLKDADSLKTFLPAIGATIVLSVFVNLIELGCTAILPTVYMASLVQSYGNVVKSIHILWTIFYSVIYIVPLMVILFNFVYTFESSRLSKNQGKLLKLVSGLFMTVFAVIMIFSPELLMFG